MAEATLQTIATTAHGRYLVRAPEHAPSRVAVVGFHGYGQRAQHLLDDMQALPGADAWLLVSVQGLHRFYIRATGEVVAHWMTSEDRELAIADNVAYVDAVVRAVAAAHPFERLVFLGFSQGASMAHSVPELWITTSGAARWATTVRPDRGRGIPSRRRHLPAQRPPPVHLTYPTPPGPVPGTSGGPGSRRRSFWCGAWWSRSWASSTRSVPTRRVRACAVCCSW